MVVIAVGAAFGLLCLMLVAWLAMRAGLAERRLAACALRERELRRLLRLSAADMRAPVLSLMGHAPHVPPALAATLTGACRSLLDTAEALLEQTEEAQTQRVVRLEDVALGKLAEFVVAQVAGQLGPGRRAWRLDPGLRDVVLRADRRAVHQCLLRVVSAAAMATGEGDGIALLARPHNDRLAVAVEDEGTGLALSRIDGHGLETRGIGVGMALVNRLMQAHGGCLRFESTSLVGTRAVLDFPPGSWRREETAFSEAA